MAITTNKGYALPTVGGSQNAWGTLLNGDLAQIDANLGGTLTLNVAGNSNVVLTAAQASNLIYELSGVLTGDIELIFPPTGGLYIIVNNTTGAFDVTAITSQIAAVGTVVAQGVPQPFATDGTTFFPLSNGTQYGDLKDSALGIEGGGWRLCYGQTRPQTDPLWQFLVAQGLTASWTPGFTGSSTYNMPDFRGRNRFGQDNMGGSAANRVTSAVSGIDGTVLLAVGGDQHAQEDTITTTLGGTITATSAATSTVSDPGHSHTQGANSTSGAASAIIQDHVGNNVVNFYPTTGAFTGITVGTAVTTTIHDAKTASSTSGLTGASQNMPPGGVVAVLMFVGA